MQPADVYVSSPWGFAHAVAYPDTQWEERVVAVQCRLLMTREEEEDLLLELAGGTGHTPHSLLAAVCAALNTAAFRMPTLDEVHHEAEQLRDSDINARSKRCTVS